MNAKRIVVACLPLVGAIGLFGCPEKPSGGQAEAGASSAAPTADPTAQPTAQATTTTDGGKPVIMPMPHLNIDAAAALIDAAAGLIDAGLAALPDAAPPATTDSGAPAATGVPPECDQYAAQQEVCIQKMAAAAQGPARAALAAAKSSWPAQATANRAGLQGQCKALLAAAQTCK